MFWKKKYLCSSCKTGKASYELDRHSQICPYIVCLKDGKCKYFSPLEKTGKFRFWGKHRN